MMGTKIRSFAPLPRDLSLEDLVPKNHFYRRLQARLDLSFVRELVAPLYAKGKVAASGWGLLDAGGGLGVRGLGWRGQPAWTSMRLIVEGLTG